MKNLMENRNSLLKIVTLILFLNTLLLANSADTKEGIQAQSLNTSVSNILETEETEEVALDSFGSLGIILMVVLSSLLGAFFVRDEFAKGLE